MSTRSIPTTQAANVMRRGILILALGLAGAAIAYCCFYRMGTTTPRELLRSQQPELAWLKQEFNLNDREFARIVELHEAYLPQCKVRCMRITELNDKLMKAISATSEWTPEIEKLLTERGQTRTDCQTEMLKHFFEVSRTMRPEQGKRYLAWVLEQTGLREPTMNHGETSHDEKGAADHHH